MIDILFKFLSNSKYKIFTFKMNLWKAFPYFKRAHPNIQRLFWIFMRYWLHTRLIRQIRILFSSTHNLKLLNPLFIRRTNYHAQKTLKLWNFYERSRFRFININTCRRIQFVCHSNANFKAKFLMFRVRF